MNSRYPFWVWGSSFARVACWALVKSGRGVFIYLAAACGALTVLGLVIESRVVTLREEIADTLDAIATDLESNDPDRILRHIATSRPGVRETAAQLLKEVSIDRVSVKNNLRIRPVENTEPEQLVADFNAVIIGTYQREGNFVANDGLVFCGNVRKGRRRLAGAPL